MKSWLVLTALLTAALVPSLAHAQRYARTTKKVAYTHSSGMIVARSNDCGCGRCQAVCRPICCPQIIPKILKGIGRAMDCLLPTCGPCGGCHGCATRAPSCGCGHPGPGCGCGSEVVTEPVLVPPQPTPEATSYRAAREAQAARSARYRQRRRPYQSSSAKRRATAPRRVPTPAKTSPTPVNKPRTVSYPAGVKILKASYDDVKSPQSKRKLNSRLNFDVPVNPLR